MTSLWAGRFTAPIDEDFKSFNDSFAFDVELLPQEIAASKAWAAALCQAGAIDEIEKAKLTEALDEIGAAGWQAGSLPSPAEDVHSFVEAKLREKLGDLGAKIHTGRSRNDQVATDLRLYIKEAFAETRSLLLNVAGTLATRAAEEASTVMPGYTHLKQAEPITFGHWCLAYAEMLLRDADRFATAAVRNDECPLGSGALAGSPLGIDRHALAVSLGFARPTASSLDGVADRDALLDYLYAATTMLSHLSRMAEDLIFFSTDEVGFVGLPDALSTGSSRMPQKKNPDLLELLRGHAARAIGELTGAFALLKGLPLAYNKDLQLDKEPMFRMRKMLRVALPALERLLAGITLDREKMRGAASSDLLQATQLADLLAARGVPFRKAHEIVGRRFAVVGPEGEEGITADDLAAATAEAAVAKKDVFGGTAPVRVARAAEEMITRIARLRLEPTRNATSNSPS
jgi:argininosuccinate lyase